MIESGFDATREALKDIYRVAEGLYMAHRMAVPDGRTFSRSLDATAERCYNAAVVTYFNVTLQSANLAR